MKIVAISAGLGLPSSTHMLAERLAAATGAAEVQHLELRLVAHDLVNALVTHVNSPALQQALDDVVAADGLVVVTPVFNAGYAGLFKMFFDVLQEGALLDKPVLLGATGGSARHSLAIDQAMLPLFFYLKAAVVPTAVFAATPDWGDATSGLVPRIERAGRELAGMVQLRRGGSLADGPVAAAPEGTAAPTPGADSTTGAGGGPVATSGELTLGKSFEDMFGAI